MVCVIEARQDASNDDCLLKLLRKTANTRGILHFMIMGDFNFPDIDYEHGIVETSTNTAAAKFFDETQDLFLYSMCMQLHDTERASNHRHSTMSSQMRRT